MSDMTAEDYAGWKDADLIEAAIERDRLLEENARLRASLEKLADIIPYQCDRDNPRVHIWCCTHQKKGCTAEADVAEARALLERKDGAP